MNQNSKWQLQHYNKSNIKTSQPESTQQTQQQQHHHKTNIKHYPNPTLLHTWICQISAALSTSGVIFISKPINFNLTLSTMILNNQSVDLSINWLLLIFLSCQVKYTAAPSTSLWITLHILILAGKLTTPEIILGHSLLTLSKQARGFNLSHSL